MEHYYTNKENIHAKTLIISGEEARHLLLVLRKNKGNEIFVTDGEKNLYRTEIIKTGKQKVECSILEQFYDVNEPRIQVTLYQSLLKNPSRFEFVIEKAVELGVHKIVPLITENVIGKKTERKERWQAIALSAMKQSKRTYLPEVTSPMDFSKAVMYPSDSLKLIADERKSVHQMNISHLQGHKINYSAISVLIGPEGGFTAGEVETAVSSGFQIISLGERKLRSETAGILAVGLLLSN
jgi:16S rRNA (uracil1498-N3)-methyltransferase